MSFEFTGRSIIGGSRGSETGKRFTAYSPATGEPVGPEFFSADSGELVEAAMMAEIAFEGFSGTSGKRRAGFLRTIASNLEGLKDELAARASLETGLPISRFEGETGRTCAQLRLFAEIVEEGSWVDARIDRADPNRSPLPKPDVRSMLRPVGPVAVFCASNFPIAFSVAGGDTASALAAGCPVVVNAHFAHPGTAEIAGTAVADAVRECGLPEGTFSLLFSADHEIGRELVRSPAVKAVGFTGSRAGGRALMDIAGRREEPIPVFAEMSSVNPIFILPDAAAERPEAIAEGLFASFTLGAGQFCTKPGIVAATEGEGASKIVAEIKRLASEAGPAPLLTSGIRDSYRSGTAGRGERVAASGGYEVYPEVLETDAAGFVDDRSRHSEIFGPATLVVTGKDAEDLVRVARSLEGQLTATVHGTAKDLAENAELISVLERKAGRLVYNGFPTGVEVCRAMVHGGPFPATSDPRTTSVGTRAIERFSRLICYQDFPQNLLPEELKDPNPLGIVRMVDGVTGKD